MSEVVISVENLSKQYRLGQVGTGTMSHDINRWWYSVRGKEDPYLKIGESNDRTVAGNSDYVWSLKDINFDVKQGEVLGIIGKNGAGKSTLLKILSRVTQPTTGNIKVKGRIASLLEVGTGFHPELSGRENIFLNGAILGMNKQEIKSKFDEIVDFSGVERYIDTPVKRYSSGMYVRLAFAVAAHLEPEVLIIDEVLAVGDAEFQKKCLGKMKDVSGQGRTVLFVSHNMAAVSSLCTKALVLLNGEVKFIGEVEKGIDCYLENENHLKGYANLQDKKSSLWKQNKIFSKLMSIETLDKELNNQSVFKIGNVLNIKTNIEITELRNDIEIVILFYGNRGALLGFCSSAAEGFKEMKLGINEIIIEVPALNLMPGEYTLGICVIHKGIVDDANESAIDFDIISNNFTGNYVDFDRFKGYGNINRSSWRLHAIQS